MSRRGYDEPDFDESFGDEGFDDVEGGEDDGGFEEFGEDFAVDDDRKIRVLSGLDTFGAIFAFVLSVAAIVFMGSHLYEVYDWRAMGILDAKEQPADVSGIGVVEFGRSADWSGSYDYVTLNSGRTRGLEPGMILYLGEPGASTVTASNAWLSLIVTSEITDGSAKAAIVGVNRPRRAIADGGEEGEVSGRLWARSPSDSYAVNNLSYIALSESFSPQDLTVSSAGWSDQTLLRQVEEDFNDHVRVRPTR